jgi:hypothetical protein
MPAVKFHADEVDIKVFPMCIDDVIEFNLVSFCTELQRFLVRQKYHSLENLYEFCSLPWNVLGVSSEYVFPILLALGCL